MKRLASLAIAGAVACSAGLTAAHVSAASSSASVPKAPKLAKGVTLHITDWFDQNNKNDPGRLAMEKVANTWAKKTGNHVVFDGSINNIGGDSKLCVSAPAGQAPDLIGTPHDQLAVMAQCKAIAPVPAWAFTPAMKKEYIPAAIKGITLYGKVYGMPWSIETTGLWYNKALISPSVFKAGAKLTWQTLIPKLQKLTTGDKHGFAFDLGNFYYAYAFISADGGYVFKYVAKKGFDYNQIGLDTPGAVKGLTFIKDLTTNGKYKLQSPDYTYNQALSDFENGKLAVFYTGPWERENFVKAGINFGYAPLPSLDGKRPMRPFSGVQVYSVNAYSKHRNEAFALLSYMTRAMQKPEISIQGRPPVLKSLFTSNAVRKDPVIAGLAQQATVAVPMPNIPEMGQVWTPMASALSLMEKGSLTPSDAASQAVAKIKSDIAKAHGG